MDLIVKRLLPLGSIVILKGTSKTMMVIANQVLVSKKGEKRKYMEYCGCLYPEGVIDSKTNYFFNDEDIEKIVAYGLITDEEFRKRLVKQNKKDNKKIESE